MTEEQIKIMVYRFLNWHLPENFNPDGGITFKKSETATKYNHPMPTGTNLLDTTQATAMVYHMLGVTFQKDEYAYLAKRLREAKDDAEFKALLSNNHNVILAALDRQSQ
jgi:uncharacterized protein (UPF0276 family)